MARKTSTKPISVSSRVAGFSYAIRNIASEAKKVEAAGGRVRYLNIGDPALFGFATPGHLVEAVEKALRDGCNAYTPSPGIQPAREAIAADYARRGLRLSPERVVITMGASEGIELALSAILDEGDEVLVPTPTYPLYTAVIARLGAAAVYYPTDPQNGWVPIIDALEERITPRSRAIVVIDPNNPTGAAYGEPVRRGILEVAERHGLVVLADEVYADLAYDGPVAPLGSLAPESAVISFNSLSKGYLAPGWRTGWLAANPTPRLDDTLAAIVRLADGRLCSTGPMQYAIAPALQGDRSHQVRFTQAIRERAQLITARLNAIEGMSCVAPGAAFYVMPRLELPTGATDEDFVLGLVQKTGVLCVHGSGFGTSPEDGYFRIVALAAIPELEEVCALIASFAREFRASAARTSSPRPPLAKPAAVEARKLVLGD
ncbi:MAG TPA: aminotransferase class I/II-fold pyridoxal phosphate-dependent enzyme [Myxococcaceae bacterium]|nr:aminotransferase class I/II-fold pyridoxal phosphate-dependent enzyme [Myxococcaceae bacterium]